MSTPYSLKPYVAVEGWGNLSAPIWAGNSDYQWLVSVMANASYLSYTSTYGSYFNPADVNRSISEDWTREYQLESNPIDGGMRALLFTHRLSNRALIAFRGTDLGNSSGAIVDQCANAILWDGASRAQGAFICFHTSLAS